MNRKQFLLLLGVAIVIGALALVMHSREQASFQENSAGAGQKLLGNLAVNDIAQLTVSSGTNHLNLVKKDDSWRVAERGDYPANFSTIRDFIRKAADLKVIQSEEIGPSQLGRLELLPPGKAAVGGGTLVEFKDKGGKALKAVLLGKKQMKKSDTPSPMGDEGFPVGRWVQDQANTGSAILISDALNEAEPRPDQWLDKEFFKIEKVRAITLTATNATNSWKASRATESSGWTLENLKAGEQVDTNKLSSLGSVLSSPSFNDVAAADSKPSDTGMNNPTVIKLETFDDFTYAIKVGKQTGDAVKGDVGYYLAMNVSADLPKARAPGKDEKPADKDKLDREFKEKNQKLAEKLQSDQRFEKYTYVVSKWTLDSLLKDRASFMIEKKEEPKKDEPAKDGKSASDKK